MSPSSIMSLGFDGLWIAAGMTLLATLTLAYTRWQLRRDAEKVEIHWSTAFDPKPAPGAIPAELEPYVDYERAVTLNTAPIDYARAMKAAAERTGSIPIPVTVE